MLRPFIDVNPKLAFLVRGLSICRQAFCTWLPRHLPTADHYSKLHALDLATGRNKLNGPVDIAASIEGYGGGAVAGVIHFDPWLHIQRPALLLSNGAVYVAFGSHSDFGVWHGWLMSYDASDLSKRLELSDHA